MPTTSFCPPGPEPEKVSFMLHCPHCKKEAGLSLEDFQQAELELRARGLLLRISSRLSEPAIRSEDLDGIIVAGLDFLKYKRAFRQRLLG